MVMGAYTLRKRRLPMLTSFNAAIIPVHPFTAPTGPCSRTGVPDGTGKLMIVASTCSCRMRAVSPAHAASRTNASAIAGVTSPHAGI